MSDIIYFSINVITLIIFIKNYHKDKEITFILWVAVSVLILSFGTLLLIFKGLDDLYKDK